MGYSTEQILEINDKRLDELTGEFNPVTGKGSFIERFPFKIKPDSEPIYLPTSMHDRYGSVKDSLFDEVGKESFKEEFHQLVAYRSKMDFEYWAHLCAKVKHKLTAKMVPFILNRPQRKALAKLMEMWDRGEPMRLIILKARQWGGSTLVQIFAAFIQLEHEENWNSAVVTQFDDQARNIRSMYSNLLANYPISNYQLVGFEGSSKNKVIKERGCVQYIASYESPDSLRSSDLKIAHLSEIGLWQSTPLRDPKDLVASVSSSVPNEHKTLLVHESTAKGMNFFHDSWEKSERGDGYPGIFVPWFDNPFDIKRFRNINDKLSFCESLNDYEQELFQLGATLEGINWYRDKLRDLQGDEDKMKEENPSTPEEAFQSTGSPAFDPNYVSNIKRHVRDPEFRGEIFADSSKGPDAFSNIRISKVDKGQLSVWAEPNVPNVDDGYELHGQRYVVSMDLGGVSKGSDYTSITVLDRYWKAIDPEHGMMEVAAHWYGHIDPDLAAWKAAQIAMIYGGAILAIEVNTYETRHKKTDGDHGFTAIDEVADHYENVYASNPPDKVREGAPLKYGFRTDRNTKPLIIDNYRGLLRDGGYVEKRAIAIQEASTFEVKPDGRIAAADGKHDDVMMDTMIGAYVETKLEPLELVEKASYAKHSPPKVINSPAAGI